MPLLAVIDRRRDALVVRAIHPRHHPVLACPSGLDSPAELCLLAWREKVAHLRNPLTIHAEQRAIERGILLEWIDQAIREGHEAEPPKSADRGA